MIDEVCRQLNYYKVSYIRINEGIFNYSFSLSFDNGKVRVGQRVNVKLNDFPYNEYGMLRVKIKNISLVPVVENNQSSYVLEVEFPDPLTTTYKKTISFRQQISGQAEIITDDTRLLEKLLNPIRAIFDKQDYLQCMDEISTLFYYLCYLFVIIL